MNSAELAIARRVRKTLVRRFPKCFRDHGAPKWPVKHGIYLDLRAACPGLTLQELGLALADYMRGMTYQLALVAGAERRDLNGDPAGKVSAHDAKVAAFIVGRMTQNNARQAKLKARLQRAHNVDARP